MCSPELKVCVHKANFSLQILIFVILRRKWSHEGQSLKNMKTGWYEQDLAFPFDLKLETFFSKMNVLTFHLRWIRPALVPRARLRQRPWRKKGRHRCLNHPPFWVAIHIWVKCGKLWNVWNLLNMQDAAEYEDWWFEDDVGSSNSGYYILQVGIQSSWIFS